MDQLPGPYVERHPAVGVGCSERCHQLLREAAWRDRQLRHDRVQRLVNIGLRMITDAESIGSNIVSGIVNWISQLPSLMWNIMNNVINTIEGWVSSAFQSAKNFAGSLWDGFKKGLGINSPSFIEKQMVQISKCMDDETRNIDRYVRQIHGLGN